MQRQFIEIPKVILNLLAETHLPDLADRAAFARACKLTHDATQKRLAAKQAAALPKIIKNKCLLLLSRKIFSMSDMMTAYAHGIVGFMTLGMYGNTYKNNQRLEFYQNIKSSIETLSSFEQIYQLLLALNKHAIDNPGSGISINYALICLLRDLMILQFPEQYNEALRLSAESFSLLHEKWVNECQLRSDPRMFKPAFSHELYQLAVKCVLMGCFINEACDGNTVSKIAYVYYEAASQCGIDSDDFATKIREFYQDEKIKRELNIDWRFPLQLQQCFPAYHIAETFGGTNVSFNQAAAEYGKAEAKVITNPKPTQLRAS